MTNAATSDKRTFHVYMPYALGTDHGVPPMGAKALCGHLRATDDPEASVGDDPRTCSVCLDRWEAGDE
jgi:hypothetical protein